jgi:hypothetical protein
MKSFKAYIDCDDLQYKEFTSSEELKEFIDTKIKEERNKLILSGYSNIEFEYFCFSTESDSCMGESENYRATLTLYFSRDETLVECEHRLKREEVDREYNRKRAEENEKREELLKKSRYEEYLRLKNEFEPSR